MNHEANPKLQKSKSKMELFIPLLDLKGSAVSWNFCLILLLQQQNVSNLFFFFRDPAHFLHQYVQILQLQLPLLLVIIGH